MLWCWAWLPMSWHLLVICSLCKLPPQGCHLHKPSNRTRCGVKVACASYQIFYKRDACHIPGLTFGWPWVGTHLVPPHCPHVLTEHLVQAKPFWQHQVEPTPIVNRVLGHTDTNTKGAWRDRTTLVSRRLIARVQGLTETTVTYILQRRMVL